MSSPRARSIIVGLVMALIVCLAFAFLLLGRPRLASELEALPAPERSALYERTLQTLRTTCMHAAGPKLSDYCREQSEFIKRFPECTRECRELTARFARRPSR